MSEYNTSEANEMLIGSDEILLDRIKRSVLSNEAPKWSELLESCESSLGQIISTRLAINGFWNDQSRQLLTVMSDAQAADIESKSKDFIVGLNKKADKFIGIVDENDSDEPDVSLAENMQRAIDIMDADDSVAFAQSVLSMKSDEDFTNTTKDKLLGWVNSSRAQIAEDVWGYVQDYREDRDPQQFRSSIDNSFARMSQMARGSILQR